MSASARPPEGGVTRQEGRPTSGLCLRVQALSKRFGGLPAIDALSLTVMPGERRLILGPNGAGKTTLFNLVTGELAADSGSVSLFGRDVSRLCAHERAAAGMARTYQILTLFGTDTVLHNVVLALLGRSRQRWNPWARLQAQRHLADEAHGWLARVGLEAAARRQVSQCSYGEKRRLEIALALAQRPRLLLLDEPLAGLSVAERRTVLALIESIPASTAIVMIEHDMDMALAFAERISLLQQGRLVLEGTRAEVVASPRTREVYLGH